jgi:hypothetical protein
VNATVSPAATSPLSLNNSDRCDRCGAQARVRVVLATGDLVFCAHHAKAYDAKLRAEAIEYVDETAGLVSEISS